MLKKFLGSGDRENATSSSQEDDKPIDWSSIYKEHKGKWVALQDDEKTVIASGNTVKEAMEASKKKGFDNPILTLMPDNLTTYIG